MIYKKIILEGKQKVFFTSDTHFNHKNICRGTTTWDLRGSDIHSSTRDFSTIEEMNNAIVKEINNTVKEDDYLVHLGDWSFGGIDKIWEFRSQINCKNIILILGNHDEKIANNNKLNNCWIRSKDGKLVSLENSTSDWDEIANAQDIFNNEVYPYLELTVSSSEFGKQTYNLMHFPLAVWNKAHHNRIHLFGHVHGSYEGQGRSLDVGIDNAKKVLGEYKPFSQLDINAYMENKKFIQKSHHNENNQ